jgi:hypothetical protein
MLRVEPARPLTHSIVVVGLRLAADQQVNGARPVWLTRFDLASVAADMDPLVHQSVSLG